MVNMKGKHDWLPLKTRRLDDLSIVDPCRRDDECVD